MQKKLVWIVYFWFCSGKINQTGTPMEILYNIFLRKIIFQLFSWEVFLDVFGGFQFFQFFFPIFPNPDLKEYPHESFHYYSQKIEYSKLVLIPSFLQCIFLCWRGHKVKKHISQTPLQLGFQMGISPVRYICEKSGKCKWGKGYYFTISIDCWQTQPWKNWGLL